VTFTMTGLVGESRDEYPQLVTTGCVAARPGATPLACDADSNALRLPARSSWGSVLLVGIAGAIGFGLLAVRHWPRRTRQPIRPVRPLPRRFPRQRSPRPVYVPSREAAPAAVVFAGGPHWSSGEHARSPPSGGSKSRSGVRSGR
jgi:hypothetical protein